LEEIDAEEEKQLHVIRARLSHLQSASDPTAERRFNGVRLNRILVDYMLREGYHDSAKTMANSTGINVIFCTDWTNFSGIGGY
jgi:hypothetical protein